MDSNDQIHQITLRDYLRVLFGHKLIILTTLIAVLGTVTISLKLKTPLYESQVKMLITAEKQFESSYYKNIYDAGRNIQQTVTQSEIVNSNPVLRRVVSALHLDQKPLDDEKKFSSSLKAKLIDYNVKKFNEKIKNYSPEKKKALFFRKAIISLKQNISVKPIQNTNMFTITFKDYDPVNATIIANVISRSYVIFDLEQQLAELELNYGYKYPTVNLIQDHILELTAMLAEDSINDIKAMGPASVKIIEQASVPLRSVVGMSKKTTFLMALVMSCFLGGMLAFIFEYMDQTFKSPQDIENILNIPFLGSIPKKKVLDRTLIKNMNKSSSYVKAYQTLSDQIYLLMKDKKLKSLLVTSLLPKEGTVPIIANLGRFLANKLDQNVLIIDANLRTPSLHKIFKTKKMQGLANVLEGKSVLEDVIQDVGKKLSFICAGKIELNPITLLDSSAMATLLVTVKEKYPIVLMECSSLRDSRDTQVIAPSLDGIILVLDEGVSRRQVVKKAITQLKKENTVILGAVLNNRTFTIPGFIYEWV